MRLKKLLLLTSTVVCITLTSPAQSLPVNPALLRGSWPASWITCPDVPLRAYGIYHFRKKIVLDSKPEHFIVHASGDNRYRLFVNGHPVCNGPARGDLYNWNFETVDLGPYLQAGSNTLAALVWNMGEYAPVAQVSNQTAFLLQGDTEKEMIANTDKSWKVTTDKAYQPLVPQKGSLLDAYGSTGPGDRVKAALYPWHWEESGYDDTQWLPATRICHPTPAGYSDENLWTLVPRSIPPMEERQQRIIRVRRTSGIQVSDDFLKGNKPFTILPHKTVSLLLDQTYNTVAYPELWTSGGKDSRVKITYAEALFKDGKKGHRDEIEGREIKGHNDEFEPDGGPRRLFRPLWIRTYRYMQLDIVTGDSPLVIHDLYGIYTGYPFTVRASFSSNDSSLRQLWEVGWRTARLCAGETYFDCPYYEQLQYVGDTRIQSLISLYVTGDDRLMRKAIFDFYNSRVPEGLTQSRYPSHRLQVIPPFSLFWVSMIHDYFMHRKDTAFVRQLLTGIRGVLDWYEKNVDRQTGMLGAMKWWNFADWALSFPNGVPAGATDGHSAILSLQYAYTLDQAADIFAYLGDSRQAEHYRSLAGEIKTHTYAACFDTTLGRMGDSPEKRSFSQHAGIMGVLTGAIPDGRQKEVMKKVLYDTTLSQATFYYRFYLTLALKRAGMADLYYSQLTPWRNMLKIGLTTFAENPEPTRSDCHAWSASPNYDLLATICGIMPDAPGFGAIRIQPALGELKEVKGSMPHPDGEITVHLLRKGEKGIHAIVWIPEKVTGKFVWEGHVIPLTGGQQTIDLD